MYHDVRLHARAQVHAAARRRDRAGPVRARVRDGTAREREAAWPRHHSLHLHPAARRLRPRRRSRLAADLHRARLPEHDPARTRDHRHTRRSGSIRAIPTGCSARSCSPRCGARLRSSWSSSSPGCRASRRSSTRRQRCSEPASSSASAPSILPMLKPALQVALLLRIIFAFEVFASVIAITGRAKTTLAGQALRWQGEYLDTSRGCRLRTADPVLSLVAAASCCELVRTPRGADAPLTAIRSPSLSRAGACTCSRSRCRSGSILPIYFITLGAFSTQDAVYAYPRELLPHHLSTDDPAASSCTRTASSARSSAAFRSRRSRSPVSLAIGIAGRLRARTLRLPRRRSRSG